MKNRNLAALVKFSRYTTYICLLFVLGTSLFIIFNKRITTSHQESIEKVQTVTRKIAVDAWQAPDEKSIPTGSEGEMIRYGKELIAHTGKYFGPRGSIAQISNGMNCQNCHPDGGTKYLGNNYALVSTGYPRMSYRAGRRVPVSERVIECFERSLSGTAPDTTKKEVQAMIAYMRWIGKDVKKGEQVVGVATEKLAYMKRQANPVKGKDIYLSKCQSCHGQNGEGMLTSDGVSYINPPLWGEHSYNDGAGMYRLTYLAGFIKNNMPFGVTYENPDLTDEEAWDVAAFIESQPRQHKDQSKDWIDITRKPIDFPFGPYADNFSEQQHKYGPFDPIRVAQEQINKNKN